MNESTVSLIDAKKLDPAPLLVRINSYASVDEGGGVSYTGWNYHEDIALLHGMFRLSNQISQEAARSSINRAIGICIRDKKLTTSHLVGTAKRLYAEAIGTELKSYRLLSELSIQSSALVGCYQVGETKVRILRDGFPAKYISRKVHADKQKLNRLKTSPTTYQKVIVELKARSEELAVSSGLDAIDTARALVNLSVNFSMQIQLNGERYKPINRVMLGGLHTIHACNGKSADDRFWYEPLAKFPEPYLLTPDKGRAIASKLKKILAILNGANDADFAEHLLKSLTQYARAFDEPDPSNSLLRGWSVLEQLVGNNDNGDGELVVNRVLFLFSDHEDMRLMLNVIRQARNDIAHRGASTQHLRTYCYLIQTCFAQAFHVYLGALQRKNTKKTIDKMLDLPPNVAVLESRLKQLELEKELLHSSLKFRMPDNTNHT
jgi:hypothetical protein